MKTLLLLLSFGCLIPGCSFFREKSSEGVSGIQSSLALEPQVYISYLDPEMDEGSALLMFNGKFWTLNDSGGLPVIYAFDAHTGNVLQRIRINGFENIDWEALAQDHDYLFIGDFGNNSGTRENLCIIRIRKSDIPSTGDARVEGEPIRFTYNDQTDYSFRNYRHSHDCEALIAMNDSLWLFSKDWLKESTKLYSLPAIPGNYTLTPVDSFPVDGLITDASILEAPERLVLSGYKDYSPFVWVFSDFRGSRFFHGNSKRIEMPKIFGVQAEGVFMNHPDSIFLSSEKAELPPQLYLLKLRQ